MKASSDPTLKFSKRKQTGNKTMTVEEYRATTEPESSLQSQCEELLSFYPNIKVVRVPDAAYRAIFSHSSNVPVFVKKLVSAWLRGIPDLILLRKDGEAYCKAVCVELKTAKGKQSQGQKNFAKVVPVIVCRSFEHFEEIVKDFE